MGFKKLSSTISSWQIRGNICLSCGAFFIGCGALLVVNNPALHTLPLDAIPVSQLPQTSAVRVAIRDFVAAGFSH